MKIRTYFAILLCSILALGACDSKKSRITSGEIVRHEENANVSYISGEDPEMNKAMQKARDTVDAFIAVLRSPAESQKYFSVKKCFKEGNAVEHMWLSDLTFDGIQFHGLIDDEPVDVTNVKQGEKVSVGKNEISDWGYIENDRQVGAYTARVIYNRMSPEEKKEFDNQVIPFKEESER